MNTTIAAAVAGASGFTVTAGLAGEPIITMLRVSICGGALAAAALVDVRERRIPNRIVLPAAAACALLAAIAGQGALRAVAAPLLLTTGLLALALMRPGAFGMGDVKASLLITLALGHTATVAIMLGLALAALTGIALITRHGSAALRRALPLAPFLTIGALLALA